MWDPEERIKLCRLFAQLPDEVIASTEMTAAVLNTSPRTVRRNPPTPRKQITERCFGHVVGDIRKLVTPA